MPRLDVDDQGDALAAADEGARMLREGRYAGLTADRPGMRERAGEFISSRRRWQAHLHGWGCRLCGPTMHSRAHVARHDWWHRWLEAMFGAIGTDVDKLEGELGEVRAEAEARCGEAERKAEAAVEQVRMLTQLLGPHVSRALEDAERVVQ